MITQERALETLEKFDITPGQLATWEAEFELQIPTDEAGNKLYSQLHINLFKNVKKHLALGRSIVDIKRMLVLPTLDMSAPQRDQNVTDDILGDSSMLPDIPRPSEQEPKPFSTTPKKSLSMRLMEELKPLVDSNPDHEMANNVQLAETVPMIAPKQSIQPQKKPSARKPGQNLKRFATPPSKINTAGMVSEQGPHAAMLLLIDRLMEEKDDLHNKLTLIEKQKTHLYQANAMFQDKVKTQSEIIEDLQQQIRAQQNIKLMDDKSRLQKQIIEAEHRNLESEKKLMKLSSEIEQLKNALEHTFDPKIFVGNWLEEADLVDVAFDNFGINIDQKRSRMFKITFTPERFYGNTAIIETTYDYQTNTLWKRTETLILNLINENRLEGEMIAEYSLDGTPVARAVYKIKCHRNGVQTDI